MEFRWAPSEVEGGSISEVMGCSPLEEMRGAYQYVGEGVVGGSRCLDSTSQDKCNL